MGYYRNGCLNFDVTFFRHSKLDDWRVLKYFFLIFGLKGVIEICVGCFLVYLFFGRFLWGGGICEKGVLGSCITHYYFLDTRRLASVPKFSFLPAIPDSQKIGKGDQSSVKWSNPGHFLKSQGKFFLSFQWTLFLHIFQT